MPMHDWTRVEAGIYHHFHQRWITAITDHLNKGLLPKSVYALAEQHAAGFGPDILTLQDTLGEPSSGGTATLARTQPKVSRRVEAPSDFYQRKKSAIAIRHVSGDRIIAMIEIVSPGNKNTTSAFNAFVRKACELLQQRVHLLILDPFPPSKRDPNGIHASIWAEVEDDSFVLPADQPLTLVAYECGPTTVGHIETIAVGDTLPDMPIFLEPGAHILVPLEATYSEAWNHVPARWQRVVSPP
jgi:Protein of unknown function (DUF4058)